MYEFLTVQKFAESLNFYSRTKGWLGQLIVTL